MKIKVILISAALLVWAPLLKAQDSTTYTNSDSPTSFHWGFDPNSTELYRNFEISLDAFAVGSLDSHSFDHLSGYRVRHRGKIGAGAGLDFFFNRYVGIEGEGFSENIDHTFVNDAGGNLILRYPIGESGFAPYVFGGGGHEFWPADSAYGDGGAGFEYRFTHMFGVFVDGRYNVVVRNPDFIMARVGVRFTY